MKTILITLFILLAGALSTYAQQSIQESSIFISKQPDKLFLGGLIESESLNSTDYRMVETTLNPITVSCSLGGKSVTFSPSYKNMMEAVRHYVQTASNTKPNLEFSILTKELGSYDETASFFGQTIDPQLYFGTKRKNKRMLTAFLISQSFFSISMDLPEQLCTDEEVMQQADKLIYTNTVEFGRVVLITLESNFSQTEASNALSKVLKGVSLSDADKTLLATANLHITIPGQEGITINRPDCPLADVVAYLNKPFSMENFGQPIKFRASYLRDNSVFINKY